MRLLLPFLLSLLFTGCKQSTKPVYGTFSHQGQLRSFIYYQPTDLQDDSPLLVVLHGFTSSAEKIMHYTHFNQLADQSGFAVLYPQGTTDNDFNTFWNVGYTFHADINTDDVDFIVQLTKLIQKRYKLSKEHTFLTGMSNGGEMCYKMACEKPTMFKAVAPVAGMMLDSFFEQAQNQAVPLFATFGTSDDVTRFEGDTSNVDGWGTYRSIDATINYWQTTNKCSVVETDTLPNLSADDSSCIVRRHYYQPDSSIDVLYYKVINGGHDWPGASGNMDVDISVEIWNYFFSKMGQNKTVPVAH